jgi:hypothetical protein
MMKNCSKCGLLKPLFDFYAHPKAADGRMNRCKECSKQDARANRAANIERVKEYDRNRANLPHRVNARLAYQRTEAFAESHRRSLARYDERFPHRRKAQIAAGNAIRDGRLIRQPCLICGDRAEAHHPNYDAPLDVVWLCTFHHKQAHALVRDQSTQGNRNGGLF